MGLRVLVITNTFPPGYTGGAEISNYHTCRGLIRHGIDCSILVLNNRQSEGLDEWYDFDGIPVHRIHLSPKKRTAWRDVFDSRAYRVVRKAVLELKPDLVHIHNVSGATLAPYVACRTFGLPVVNTLHDLWLLCPNNMLYRSDGSFCDPKNYSRVCKQCFRRYDYWGDIPRRRDVFSVLTSNALFLSPSRALIERHIEAGYDRQRFRLLRLGFALEEPGYPSSSLVSDLNQYLSHHRVVTFVGGGSVIKGAEVLLRALPLMFEHIENLRVIVAGAGEKRLLDRFRDFNPLVRTIGWVPPSEIRALFRISDLTLVPSTCHENSPVVIFESYNAGTPVAGSRFGGIPELIAENETGYLFPRGDSRALAEKLILHFARSAVEQRRMRQQCYKRAAIDFTLQQHISGLVQIYEEVLRR